LFRSPRAGILNLLPTCWTNQWAFEESRISMTAIAKMISHAFPASSSSDFETLKVVAIFCGIGVLESLTVASYGVDLSAGFF